MIKQIRHQSILVGIDNNSNCSNEIKLKHNEVKMTNTLKIEPTPTSVTSLTLYKEGNKFYITAYIMNTNELDIEYCDFDGPYGDYEHHLRLTEEATQKLCKIYECDLHNLLQKVSENIDWSKGTDQPFQNFCDENELKYETFTWIEDWDD